MTDEGELERISRSLGRPNKQGEIPKKSWPKKIQNRNPKRVYFDRANLVIAQKEIDGVEEGLYFVRMISLYAPQLREDVVGRFEFKEPMGSVYPYRRDLKWFPYCSQ